MIGLFIGSFNPPTLAHLEICLKLKNDFSKIIYVPVNSKEKYLVDIHDRINMLSIYHNKYPFLEVDNIMMKYSYLNYRIIDILKNKYKDVSLIMGSDLFNKLDTFDNYQYLLKNYFFVIVSRKDDEIEKTIIEKYDSYRDKFKILNYHSIVSSSMARDLIHNKKVVKNVLDNDIWKYIKENNLYL